MRKRVSGRGTPPTNLFFGVENMLAGEVPLPLAGFRGKKHVSGMVGKTGRTVSSGKTGRIVSLPTKGVFGVTSMLVGRLSALPLTVLLM